MPNSKKTEQVFDVFISYRRATGSNDARLLEQALRARGFRVFFDYNSLRSGKFDEHIFSAIEQAPVFILIVSAGCFEGCSKEDDWVRMEIEHALKCENKTVIPVAPSDQAWSFPADLPPTLKELITYQVSELNKRALFDQSVDMMIEDQFPEALKRKIVHGNVRPHRAAGALSKEQVDSVDRKYAHFLWSKKGWSEFSSMIFESSNDFLIGYKVSDSQKVPVRLVWLKHSDIYDLLDLDDDQFQTQAEKIFSDVPIAPGQSVEDAWNSLSDSFMPALLFAYDVRGLIFESQKQTILIPLKEANRYAYRNRADVCVREYRDRECVCIELDETRLSQLIGKTRVECSELVLGWVSGKETAQS